MNSTVSTEPSLALDEIEGAPRGRVNLVDHQVAIRRVGQGVAHAGRQEHHVVLYDPVRLSLDGQQALAGFHDIDIIGAAVAMLTPVRTLRQQHVDVHVEILGAERGIHERNGRAALRPAVDRHRRNAARLDDLESQDDLLRRSPRYLSMAWLGLAWHS